MLILFFYTMMKDTMNDFAHFFANHYSYQMDFKFSLYCYNAYIITVLNDFVLKKQLHL